MDKIRIARNTGKNFLLLCKTLVVAFIDGQITAQELDEIKQAVLNLLKNKNGKKASTEAKNKK